jgi:hypothetical protein
MYIKISGKIDFDLLKKQKQIFERMIQDWGEANDEQQREEASEAEGLLFLIDNIQNEGEILNISDVINIFQVKDISYEDCLSEFMFYAAGKLGGGLPNDYFNNDEIIELEIIFRKIYVANTELSNLINKVNL